MFARDEEEKGDLGFGKRKVCMLDGRGERKEMSDDIVAPSNVKKHNWAHKTTSM